MTNIIDINSKPLASKPDEDRKLHIANIVKFAPNRAEALDRMARQQIGMPTQVRMELAACSVTIRVLSEQLTKLKADLAAADKGQENLNKLLNAANDLLNQPCKGCGQ